MLIEDRVTFRVKHHSWETNDTGKTKYLCADKNTELSLNINEIWWYMRGFHMAEDKKSEIAWVIQS